MDINDACWQADAVAAETLVLRNHLPVIQGIVRECEMVRLQPLNCLHFTGEPL